MKLEVYDKKSITGDPNKVSIEGIVYAICLLR